jgi:uncharacterized protein YutE (UPF0331/DUF86 family)
MIDKDLIFRKINLISKDLKALKPISELSEKKYLQNQILEVQTERYLERIIGRMIDINYHIITENGNSPPHDYFQSFTELGKLRILPLEFSQKIANLAGLRNRISHEYNSLDERKIYRALKGVIKDVPRYLKFIEKFTENKKQKRLI